MYYIHPTAGFELMSWALGFEPPPLQGGKGLVIWLSGIGVQGVAFKLQDL
jgi:hypothetical protein